LPLADGSLALFNNISVNDLFNKITTSKNINTDFQVSELNENYLSFYLGTGHAQIELNCKTCDDSKEHRYFYDLNNRMGKQETPFFGPKDKNFSDDWYAINNYTPAGGLPLKFHLNNNQAKKVLATLNNLYTLSQNGEYKYVDIIHNCVSILTDVYIGAEFSNHYSNFFKDEELIDAHTDTHPTAFIHRFHFVKDHLHHNRKDISKFIKSVHGENYQDKWGPQWDSSTNKYGKGIKDDYINHELAKNNSAITSIIEEINSIRENYYSKLINHNLNIFKDCHNLDQTQIDSLVSSLIKKPITNYDLYYTYVINHEVDMYEIFSYKAYSFQLFEPLSEQIAEICYDIINKDYTDICLIWCDIKNNIIGNQNHYCDNWKQLSQYQTNQELESIQPNSQSEILNNDL